MGCFLDDFLRVFGINADQWTTAIQDEGEWRRTACGGTFHGEMYRCREAGLRHAAVCPNVKGRAKERIDQSKRARAGSLAIVDY